MHRSLLVFLVVIGIAAACAPHSPKKKCTKLKHEPLGKCDPCSPATITPTSASCPAGQYLLVDTDDTFAGTVSLFCQGGKWYYRDEPDPVTGVPLEGVVTGDADMNVACFTL